MRILLVTALAPIVWGTVYFVTTEFFPPDRPFLVGALRALPIGLLIVAAYRQLPSRQWWWRASVLGFLNIGLFFALLFFAAYRLPGGIAATVIAMQPLFVALLAWKLLAQKLSMVTVGAALSGIAGVGLIVLEPDAALDNWGLVASLGAAVSMAAGTVFARRWPSPVPLLLLTGWQLVAGGLLLGALAWFVEGMPPALTVRNGIGVLYLAVVATGLAFVLWFRGIKLLGVSVSFLVLLSPVAAITLGSFVLDERLSPIQIVGIVVVIASIAAGQWDSQRLARRVAGG